MALQKTLVVLFRVVLAITLIVISHLAITARSYPVVEDLNDKVSHVLAFAALAFLSDFSFPNKKFAPAIVPWLLSYGLLIEVVQYFFPYRSSSVLDWIADAIGIGVYLLAVPILKHIPLLRDRWDQAP